MPASSPVPSCRTEPSWGRPICRQEARGRLLRGHRRAPSRRMASPLRSGSRDRARARRIRRGCRAASGRARLRGERRRISSGAAPSSACRNARCDRHHADPELREVARGRQRHPHHAALRRRIGDLTDLTVERRDRRGVDDHAALAVLEGVVWRASRSAARRSTLNVPIRLIAITDVNTSSRGALAVLDHVRHALPMPAQLTGAQRAEDRARAAGPRPRPARRR